MQDHTVLISVIIPNHNSGRLLGPCLESLRQQTDASTRLEIIVVDDGSTDSSWKAADSNGVLLIRQNQKGAAAARNRGFQTAKGHYVLFLDADCRAQPGWIEQISRPLLEGEAQVTVGRFETSQRSLLARLTQLELERRFQRMRTSHRIDFINSATCGFISEVFRDHLFDEGFKKLEDVELSFKMASEGIRILFVPGAVGDHQHPERLRDYLGRKFRYGLSAPRLYWRFPSKTVGDRSTPPSRRMEIALVGAGFLALWLSLPVGILLLGTAFVTSLAGTLKVAREKRSSPLPVLLSFLSLAGSSAFLAGAGLGLILLIVRRGRERESPG